MTLTAFTMRISISIHPPREGWDDCTPENILQHLKFQSTHPVRGGTLMLPPLATFSPISIHPPREGWDDGLPECYIMLRHFNPPTP